MMEELRVPARPKVEIFIEKEVLRKKKVLRKRMSSNESSFEAEFEARDSKSKSEFEEIDLRTSTTTMTSASATGADSHHFEPSSGGDGVVGCAHNSLKWEMY